MEHLRHDDALSAEQARPADPAAPPELEQIRLHGDFALPARLFLTERRPISIFPGQALPRRGDSADWIVSFSSSDPRRAGHVISGRECVVLNPAQLAGAVAFNARMSGAPLYRVHADLEVVVSPRKASGAPIVHAIGDSLTNRFLRHVDNRLQKRGLRPRFVGTVEQDGGVMSEGREGKRARGFSGRDGEMQPVAEGDEAAYLAMSAGEKRHWNPYLRRATDVEKASRSDLCDIDGVDHVVDIAHYLHRFDLPVPDFVVIALGTNDVSADPRNAADDVRTLLAQYVPQLLALSATLRVGLLKFTIARTAGEAESRWAVHHEIIKDAIHFAANNDRVDLLPAYLHQSADIGWPGETVHADPRTGVTVRRVTPVGDANIHFDVANAMVAAELVAAWISVGARTAD